MTGNVYDEVEAETAAPPPQAAPRVAVTLADGTKGSVPQDGLDTAMGMGASPDTDTGMGSFQAGEIAFGSTIAGGLVPGAIHSVAKRIDPQWANDWRENYETAVKESEAHPVARAVGGGLGFFADMAGPLGKIGKVAGTATKGMGLAGRLAGAAAGNVGTMAAYNVGEQLTNNELSNEDSLSGDPSNFEKIFAAAGKDLLLNAAVGAGTHGLGEMYSLARKPGGLLASLPKARGPVSGEIADQVAGVPLAGQGVRAEAQASSAFIDDMTKAGATQEQAAEGWQTLGALAKHEPGSLAGDSVGGVADFLGKHQIANNPAIREAMAKGAAHQAMSATAGEAFRVAQVEKFIEAGNTALRDGVDVNNELAFGMKKESIEKTVSGAFAGHLDAANRVAQDADGFLERWAADETHGGLNMKDATKMVERFKREVSLVAERAVGGVVDNTKASAQLFQATDNLKRNFGALKKMKGPSGFGAAPFVHDLTAEIHGGPGATNYGARSVYERIQQTLEDSKTWGQAGQLQQAINAPFAEGITNESSALGKLAVALKSEGWEKVPEIHSGKAASFLDAAGSIEGKTDTRSLLDLIDNHISRANNLIEHAALGPAEAAAAERGKQAMLAWRGVVNETTERSAANARIRRMVSDEGPGLGHGPIGRLADPILRPIHNQMALEHLQHTADRATASAKRAVTNLLGWTKAPAKLTAPSAERAAAEIAGVRAAVADPERLAARTSDFIGEDTHKAAPKTAAGVGVVAARALSYLATVAPVGRSPQGLLGGKGPTRYSDQDLASWHRTSEAVKNPTAVVENAKHGSLSREGVKALQVVYPQMYEEMRQHAMGELADLDRRGKLDSMPYEQKLMMGIMLNIPADGTMTPEFISGMQATKMAAPDQPQTAPAKGGGGKRPIDLHANLMSPEPIPGR